ncbi:unnamed protein product [Polarella glacialis]|uniref:histidinol-phosphate transaminase n=1 Tax=Polarella glacialis TaxID=89957 RepID=A0A813F8H8_POLGL|nr:unnamed protein product [Polarella glacialis]
MLLDFNERTIGVPSSITDALKAYIDKGGLQKYPAYGHLQANIAEYSGVPKEQCMFTNGSDQGIDLIFRCCCDKGTEVIIPAPTFAMYEQAADSEDLVIRRPHFTQEKGFPTEEVLALVSEKTSLIVLSNPNNPTGTLIPKDVIIKIATACPNVAILVDECYFEFMDPSTTVVHEVAALPNLLVCRTFSKTWGIPSLRLGYLISAKENIDALTCVRGPYDINQLAVVAVEAAMKDSAYVFDYVKEVNEISLPLFKEYLDKKGVGYWPTWANFIFCYFEDPVRLEAGMRERGILVRQKKDANNVLGLRISIGTEQQMRKVVEALDELL